MEKYTGCGGINISSYRHVAIAISRKYLAATSQFADTTDASDEHGGDAIDATAPLDAQASHSSYVAQLVYGRDGQAIAGSLISLRDKFRTVSQAWHRLLDCDAKLQPKGRKGQAKAEDQAKNNKEKAKNKKSKEAEKEKEREEEERKAEEYVVRRWQLLRQSDPLVRLRALFLENVEFRVKQEEVLRAVYDGVSPILAVMPTGSGKSMSFILPASYEFSGTTIVVVPLLALQEDMLSRPGQLSIPARIWGRSSVDTAAKIIFVTPESARTADFLAHFHRLRTAGEIDRIVFDECHVFSDDDVTFRPAIKELVGLFQFGVRLVFLTATLPVSQELPFWRLLGLHRVPVRTIRADTTRHNLAYTVSYVQLDDRIAEIERHVNSLEHGKMIIYCRRKYTVTTLAEHLGCPYYYYYSSYEHKQASIEQFLATDKGIIITTNALGLGIDIPDVRVVIHYDCPDNLISYAQESGRAGRDGDPGRCILMVDKASLRTTAYEENNARQPQKRPHAAMDWRFTDLWLQQYIGSPDLARCRRTTLSEYLDGIQRADGCANLTRCDVCAAPATLPRTATGAPSPVPIRDHSIAFRAQQSGLELVRQHVQATQVADAVQKEQVVRFLSSMGTTCFQCLAFGRDAAHAPSDCIEPRDASYEEAVQIVRTTIKFDRYSGCFTCGMPQELCQTFVRTSYGMAKSRDSMSCTYGKALFEAAGVLVANIHRTRQRRIRLLEELGIISTPDDNCQTWQDKQYIQSLQQRIIQRLSKKTRWLGWEANLLFCTTVTWYIK